MIFSFPLMTRRPTQAYSYLVFYYGLFTKIPAGIHPRQAIPNEPDHNHIYTDTV